MLTNTHTPYVAFDHRFISRLMKRCLSILVLSAFLINTPGILSLAHADEFLLPPPGVMVHLSPALNPPILKGIKVHPDNPFNFEFILDKGDSELNNDELKEESSRLIKYFLASLTIPDKDLWVNLSPYEKDRIVPGSFGLTEMGRDLLAEDYMLKQITASLIYPEDIIGKKFWKRIYSAAAKRYGTTNIPVNTFNKVWIVPEKAVVFENAQEGVAYVIESKLKVMLEQDYLSLAHHVIARNETSTIGSNVIREIVIPELTREVNENKNFARLRQVYSSLILAAWYKKKIKDSILEQVYADKNKVAGININNPREKEEIYQRYLKAFKKGVYNYIKENIDPVTQESIPRKYFSGGVAMTHLTTSAAMIVFNWKTAGTKIRNYIKSSTGLMLVSAGLVIGSANGQATSPLMNSYTNQSTQEIVTNHNLFLKATGKNETNEEQVDAVRQLGLNVLNSLNIMTNEDASYEDMVRMAFPEFLRRLKEFPYRRMALPSDPDNAHWNYQIADYLSNPTNFPKQVTVQMAATVFDAISQLKELSLHQSVVSGSETQEPSEEVKNILRAVLALYVIAKTFNEWKKEGKRLKSAAEAPKAKNKPKKILLTFQEAMEQASKHLFLMSSMINDDDDGFRNSWATPQNDKDRVQWREYAEKETAETKDFIKQLKRLRLKEEDHKIKEAYKVKIDELQALVDVLDNLWQPIDDERIDEYLRSTGKNVGPSKPITQEAISQARKLAERYIKPKEKQTQVQQVVETATNLYFKKVDALAKEIKFEIGSDAHAQAPGTGLAFMLHDLHKGDSTQDYWAMFQSYEVRFKLLEQEAHRLKQEAQAKGEEYLRLYNEVLKDNFQQEENLLKSQREELEYYDRYNTLTKLFVNSVVDAVSGVFKYIKFSKPVAAPPLPEVTQVPRNAAMNVSGRDHSRRLGGIDLTDANLNLEMRHGGQGIQFHLNPAMLARLQDAPGFTPVVINIKPLGSLEKFLGLTKTENLASSSPS